MRRRFKEQKHPHKVKLLKAAFRQLAGGESPNKVKAGYESHVGLSSGRDRCAGL